MKNFKIKIGLLVVFVYLFIGLLSPKATAQEDIRTMTIVPPTVEQSLDPGGKAEGTMKVINDSNSPLSFTVSVNDFIVEDAKGTPNLLAPNTLSKKFSASSWIGVTPSSFIVPPHDKQVLNYYIQVPSYARPGGHYASVVFTPTNNIGIQGTGASVETKVGTLFYISVSGTINEYAMITKFLTNSFQEYGPVSIATTIKNFGDLHIKPAGQITIYDMFGRKIESSTFPKFNIFPLASRDYQNSIGAKIMIGRFRANILTSYGQNNNLPLIANVYFWVFPWKIALIIILAIIAIILGTKYWKKKSSKEEDSVKDEDQPQIIHH
ncbi:MAG: hypothetical protein Q7R31_01295 [Candidatus Levybacteria bacterium]|nr:hypothetical protein [Candidatus Levybacteria bacterium]